MRQAITYIWQNTVYCVYTQSHCCCHHARICWCRRRWTNWEDYIQQKWWVKYILWTVNVKLRKFSFISMFLVRYKKSKGELSNLQTFLHGGYIGGIDNYVVVAYKFIEGKEDRHYIIKTVSTEEEDYYRNSMLPAYEVQSWLLITASLGTKVRTSVLENIFYSMQNQRSIKYNLKGSTVPDTILYSYMMRSVDISQKFYVKRKQRKVNVHGVSVVDPNTYMQLDLWISWSFLMKYPLSYKYCRLHFLFL